MLYKCTILWLINKKGCMMRMLRYARWFFIKDIKTHHSRLEFDAINDNLPESIISLAHFFIILHSIRLFLVPSFSNFNLVAFTTNFNYIYGLLFCHKTLIAGNFISRLIIKEKLKKRFARTICLLFLHK